MKVLATRYTLIAASFFFGIATAVAIAYAGTTHSTPPGRQCSRCR